MQAEMRRVALWVSAVLIVSAASKIAAAADLVAVKVPIASADELCAGCELVRIAPDGTMTTLTPDFAAAKDPSVAFDGRTILFAGRKATSDFWQIWRIDSDGSEPTLIIADDGNASDPLHVGSLFHLDDERPTPRFVYLSDTHGWTDPVTEKKAFALYAANLDGSHPWRISFNLGTDLAPAVLANGRLLFPSRRSNGRFALMAVNNDGTDLMAYADAHIGPPHQDMVAVGRHRVYFIAADTPGPLGGGGLVYLSQRRPLKTRTVLKPEDLGWYHSPLPLSGGGLVVSFLRKNEAGGYRLVYLDPDTGDPLGREIAADGYHLIDAQEMTPRPQVRGRSSVVNMAADTGVFFCISSHISDRPGIAEAARAATRLRVIEGIPLRLESLQSDQTARRVLGVAPLGKDGSFHIEVPASTPVAFELLDAENRVVARQEDWVWVMPREWRGCIGCHEDREMAPPNVLAETVVRPAVRLPQPGPQAENHAGVSP